MSSSVSQVRQHMSAVIAAAQQRPQVITKRNRPVAVMVSTEYFMRNEVAEEPVAESFYNQLMQLREIYPPQDDTGLVERS